MIFLLFVLLLLINQLCCNAGSVCLNGQNTEINQDIYAKALGGGEVLQQQRKERLCLCWIRFLSAAAAGWLKRRAIEPFITDKRKEKQKKTKKKRAGRRQQQQQHRAFDLRRHYSTIVPRGYT